ncbi:Sulfotransferase [Christiangramia flava JLT2011]|nr:Sulfotransferase [Christiangramia flava JLT2011]
MSGLHSKENTPNFLIVGAAKAGTTSLAKYLNDHPDIYIPDKKELRFFISELIKDISPDDPLRKRIFEQSILDEKEYFENFEREEKVKGEASVHYLYHHSSAIPKIKSYLGDEVSIIIILRNPIKRLKSNYDFLYNFHYNPLRKELANEINYFTQNFNSFWYYKELGLYYEQVKAYKENFSKVEVLIFEDFIKNPQLIMTNLFRFLQVEPIRPNFKVHNKSKRNSNLKKLLFKLGIGEFLNLILDRKSILKLKNSFSFILETAEDKVDEQLLMELNEFYREDIKKLEALLKRDLEVWKVL